MTLGRLRLTPQQLALVAAMALVLVANCPSALAASTRGDSGGV
jgi:hypothetical protein